MNGFRAYHHCLFQLEAYKFLGANICSLLGKSNAPINRTLIA